MIGRSNIDELTQRVGAKIDVQDITDTSVPTRDDVAQWLEDGLIRLLGILPERMLLTFVEQTKLYVPSGGRRSEGLAGTATPPDLEYPETVNAVRILRVSLVGNVDHWNGKEVPAYIVPASEDGPSRFLGTRVNPLDNGTDYHFPNFQPIVSFIGAESGMVIQLSDSIRFTATTQPPHWLVEYVAAPRPVEEWPDNWRTPPLEWEEPLVDYAVIQAKMQDEELQQAQLILNEWERKIAEMAQGGVYGHYTPGASPSP